MDEWTLLTLKEAARLAGYQDAASLRKAIRKGHLKHATSEGEVMMTTLAWIEEYRTMGGGQKPRIR